MKKNILSIVFVLLCIGSLSQSVTLEGKVLDERGEALPGINVVVKGTIIGTVTNLNGEFDLEFKKSGINYLVFSSMGYQSIEKEIGDKLNFIIVLKNDVHNLDEVVVTALGIKREKKTLGYSVQSVKSESISAGNQTNIATSLQGKIAGVTVSSSGGAPGGSSIILIRGGSSLSGNNQPLYIVDGLPIDNSTNSSAVVASANRASDINPEDIESITILKGSTAAALYGIQAAEGAVIITTKKGKKGVEKISFSTRFSTDNVLGTPDQQSVFGQGQQVFDEEGVYTGYDLEPKNYLYSWGDKIPSGTKIYDNIKDLYSQAFSKSYNVNYSVGTERMNIFASASSLEKEGVVEGTSYEKINLTLNVSSKFRENITIGMNVKYINSNTVSNVQGTSVGGSFSNLLKYPRTVNARDYKNPDGSQKIFMADADDQIFDNPYWSMENNSNTNEIDRLIAQVNLNYNPFDFLNISYRLGTDIYSMFSKRVTVQGSFVKSRRDGRLRQFEKTSRLINSNFLVMFNKTFRKDYSIDITLGHSMVDRSSRITYSGGDKFEAPVIYSVSNIIPDNQRLTESKSRRRAIAIFGEAKFGWKNLMFLNLTSRNDKTSTLRKSKRSFYYPSVGLSLVVSDLMKEFNIDITKNNFLSYFKVRGTWARTGKDARPLASESYLALVAKSYVPTSKGYTWNGGQAGNPNLKPEFSEEFEVGFDARFLNNRVKLDVSYYNKESEDQLLNVRLPPAAGAYVAQLNGGAVKNEGFEALLDINIFPNESEFKWNLALNFATMKSTVIDLPGELTEVNNASSWTWNSVALGAAVLDGYLFGLKGKRPKKNEDGKVIIDSKGYYGLDEEIYDDVNRMPDWTLGISNDFSYKGLNFSFLFDMSIGGDIYNATEAALIYNGLGMRTADRSNTETIVLDGVLADGTVNTIPIYKNQKYYQNLYSQNSENFIEDATYIKLRYVTLSYDFPKSILENFTIDKLQIFVTGRNLLLITDYSGVDPEIATFGASVGGSGSIGLDNLSTPNIRGFDLGVKINF